MRNTINTPRFVSKGKGGPGGGETLTIVQFYTSADFTTSDADVTATVSMVISGTAASVNDAITVVNRVAVNGGGGRCYAGVAGTTGVAILADDGTWQMLDITPTMCGCP